MLREVIALEGNGARPSHMGKGFSNDGVMYTLNTIEQHSVCYTVDCRNLNLNREKSGTLQSKNTGGCSLNFTNPVLYPACYDARGNGDGEIAPTLTGDHENRITDYTGIVIEKKVDE